jgi:hypothetical protein
MRKKYFIYSFAVVALLVTSIAGCKKFLDVNKNINDPLPESVSLSYVLSAALRNISQNTALGTGLGNTMALYTHQITGRVGADRYGAGSQGWDGLYSAIANLNVIIKRGGEESRLVYAGIAKIMKAYAFSVLVDVYGDVPFSEFDKFTEGVSQPKFDNGEDIYPQLFALIDEGIADINNPAFNPSKPGSDDYIYNGNVARWTKAANTLKLKLYTQIRLVQDVSAEVTELLATPAQLINAQNESFIMPYGPQGVTDDRHPAYGDYNATQRGGQLFSPWLYEIMKGWNLNILDSLADPRLPYYIYTQKLPGANPENCTEYRDGGFVTIVFGSAGNCRDGSNSNTYSMLGLYPAGGRFNDSSGVHVNHSSIGPARAGTGARPHEFITYADRLYLEAELIQAGVIAGDAKAVFTKALDESFKQVDHFITNYIKPGSAGAAQGNVPLITTLPGTATYKAGVLQQFDEGNDDKKMELIITEKWINRIENPVDNYTDYRRTGYPVLFAPAPEGSVSSITGPDGKVIPVNNDRKYPLTLPFNLGEIQVNSNAPPQKVPETYKVFWQP